MNELKAFAVSHVRIPNSKFVILNCFVSVPVNCRETLRGQKLRIKN
jgi:hypothetical protein